MRIPVFSLLLAACGEDTKKPTEEKSQKSQTASTTSSTDTVTTEKTPSQQLAQTTKPSSYELPVGIYASPKY